MCHSQLEYRICTADIFDIKPDGFFKSSEIESAAGAQSESGVPPGADSGLKLATKAV